MNALQMLKEEYSKGQLSKTEFIRQMLDIHNTLFDYVAITKSTDVNEISVTPEGVSFLIGKEKIRLFSPAQEARVAPIEIMNFAQYEPEETKVMDVLSSGAQQILDIGANIGWYSVRFAKRNPLTKVHAFEPMPISNAYCQRNVALNGIGHQVCCYNYGLSDTGGSFDFFVAPGNGTNASLLNVSADHKVNTVVGLTLTLDQWSKNQSIRPDFIKCDVEGAELLVFRGGEETLKLAKPIVFSELLRKWTKPFCYHPNDMLDFFNALGYKCYAVGGSGVRCIERVTDDTLETNYAFLHSDVHGSAIAALESLK